MILALVLLLSSATVRVADTKVTVAAGTKGTVVRRHMEKRQTLQPDPLSYEACTEKVDGCESTLEVMREGECVMAHELPQYPLGKDILATISNFEKMMKTYYGGDTSDIENVMNISASARAVLVEKMRRAVSYDKKFVVASLGSSVTAGSDNCFIDSYPAQLESLLKPMFEQIGVKFESRNGGLDGYCLDTFFNQVPCMAHIVGDDVDVTSFSWDYWTDDPEFQEYFIRTSLALPKKAMPLLITLHTDHYPTHDQFYQRYGQHGYHSIAATSNTVKMHVPSRDAENSIKWGHTGDGWQRMTRLGGMFPDGHCRRESTSVFWRNWHGGPMLYQHISDAMGWNYVRALKEALTAASEPSVDLSSVDSPGLPGGLFSQVASPPKCISFNKPTAVDAQNRRTYSIALRTDMSESLKLEAEDPESWRFVAACEQRENRCQHKGLCGVAKGNVTLDLHADVNVEIGGLLKPLPLGKLVVCIGGGHYDDSDWEFPIFPRCGYGALESIQVDGHSLNLLSATKWFTDAQSGQKWGQKCGVFQLADKSARLVAIRTGGCGVTHVFAM